MSRRENFEATSFIDIDSSKYFTYAICHYFERCRPNTAVLLGACPPGLIRRDVSLFATTTAEISHHQPPARAITPRQDGYKIAIGDKVSLPFHAQIRNFGMSPRHTAALARRAALVVTTSLHQRTRRRDSWRAPQYALSHRAPFQARNERSSPSDCL